MFEQIIQYFIEKGELHERAARDARSFAAYLEQQTEYTKGRLKDVIQQFNYENIKPINIEKINYFPHLEFWRDVDDFTSVVALGYDGDVDILRNLEPIVKGQYFAETKLSNTDRIALVKAQTSVKIDLQKYPISLLDYYEYKLSQTTLFYTWIAYLWQEVEGHRCGLKAKTVENNSIEQFSLNDFLVDHFSAFIAYDRDNKPPRIDNLFPRKLTIVELFLRVSHGAYPHDAYKNHWRYFEKEDEFSEIVTYAYSTGFRSGKVSERQTAEVRQIKHHENSKAALTYGVDFSNQAIFNGWEEKFRPLGLPEMMHGKAYDFGQWAWDSGNKQLNAEDILNFEEHYKIKLPDAYFEYLRLFNGRKYYNPHLYFPINDLYTVKVDKFYSLEELSGSASISLTKNPNFLYIGLTDDDGYLGICIQKESQDYGKVVIDRNGNVQICDYSFEKFARYPQSSPVHPEVFAAQENNISFFKERLEGGRDFNANTIYQDAIDMAAQHNAHETLEFLLQNGIRLKHRNHREMPWAYDEKTMRLLDQYT